MPKIPERIGKYTIDALIARGGMGDVYRASHPTLKRSVVLKRLNRRGSSDFAERFRREARIMMGFRNDHIVTVFDHFKEGSSYYIVSEYVDGVSLEGLIGRERYLPDDIALLIFADCCRALAYAHAKGVVHRDIKPGNILISRDGEVKLTDFGVAVSKEDDDARLTRAGTTVGTPSYMAPEQFRNAANVDTRADIYSLGVMLYEMVTGRKPFPGGFTADALARIQKGRYMSPRRINPGIAPAVSRIIRRCMRVKPHRRYETAERPLEVALRRLEGYPGGRVRERIECRVKGEEAPPLRRRRPALRRALAGAFALLVGAAAGLGAYLTSQGYHHEVLSPETHGALVVSVRTARGRMPPERLDIGASIFQDDAARIPEVKGVAFRFRRNEESRSDRYWVFESQRVYLPPGPYRLKVEVENRLYWKTFHLRPRTMQRSSLATRRARELTVVWDPPASRPLDLVYSVSDQVSGADMISSAEVALKRGARWQVLPRPAEPSLFSGGRYQLRFRRAGYFPRFYDLLVEPYQTGLRLDVTLVPRPGRLRIDCNSDGLDLLLNGLPMYVDGSEERVQRRLPALDASGIDLVLSPGEYTLTVERSREVKRSIRVRVDTGRTAEVGVRFEAERNELHLERIR